MRRLGSCVVCGFTPKTVIVKTQFCGESLHDHLIYPAQFDQLAFEDSKADLPHTSLLCVRNRLLNNLITSLAVMSKSFRRSRNGEKTKAAARCVITQL